MREIVGMHDRASEQGLLERAISIMRLIRSDDLTKKAPAGPGSMGDAITPVLSEALTSGRRRANGVEQLPPWRKVHGPGLRGRRLALRHRVNLAYPSGKDICLGIQACDCLIKPLDCTRERVKRLSDLFG